MAEQTRCDLYEHRFSLWKEGGETYMRCDYCPAVRPLTAEDLKTQFVSEDDDLPKKSFFSKWEDIIKKMPL